MSEAGLSVAKPGYQWRLVGNVRVKTRAPSCGTCRWKTPRARESCLIDERQGKRVLVVSAPVGSPSGAGAATGGVWSHLTGLADSRERWRGSTPESSWVSGRTAQVAAAGRRGVNHVTTQGRRCRKRPSDIVEDGSVLLLTLRRRQEDRAGRGGPGGASRRLGSWDPSGCS